MYDDRYKVPDNAQKKEYLIYTAKLGQLRKQYRWSADTALVYALIESLSRGSSLCYLTEGAMADILGISRRTVERATKQLISDGAIIRIDHNKTGYICTYSWQSTHHTI